MAIQLHRRLLIATGRAEEVEAVVTPALKQSTFIEQRLRLLEVLGESYARLGETKRLRPLAKQLLRESPISAIRPPFPWIYCEKALRWMSWLGEQPLPERSQKRRTGTG